MKAAWAGAGLLTVVFLLQLVGCGAGHQRKLTAKQAAAQAEAAWDNRAAGKAEKMLCGNGKLDGGEECDVGKEE